GARADGRLSRLRSAGVTNGHEHPAARKLELALAGARLDATVQQNADMMRAALPHGGAVRSLEIDLPDGTRVLVPIEERDPPASRWQFVAEKGRLALARDGGARMDVRIVPPPRFYERRTTHGTPMSRVAMVQGTHLVVNPSTMCGFSVRGAPCRFCVEGAR